MAHLSAPATYDASAVSLAAATITRDAFTSAADIAATVRRWGIVVFPGLIKGQRLAQLNTEFDALIAQRKAAGVPIDEYENIINLRLKREALGTGLPATAQTFAEPYMSETADAYFGPGRYRLNGEIFVSQLTETKGPQTAPPFALHFDKRQVLKFFIYLTDTDERNGAMRALPGSNVRNRQTREDAMSNGAIADIANVLPEPATPSMPICGPAGTLFVFDTDVCHGASAVQAGFTRRTMRGHTHSHAMLDAMGVAH